MESEVKSALAWLKKHSTKKDYANLQRFGITADTALGVSVANIRLLAKQLGRNHELAAALWATDCYEARMLSSFVDEPERVTPTQMNRWAKDFDNWALCDTVCFHLFDRTPHAWDKVFQWNDHSKEFIKRASFALIASIAGHDKLAPDALFLESLPLIEQAATDDRNFVKKAVSWALRSLGGRNATLHAAALDLAQKLSQSPEASARWVGKDALRDLKGAAMQRRLASRKKAAS